MRKPILKLTRDIRSSWAQFASLILLVALGVACFVGLNAAYKDLAVSYDHTYDVLHLADALFALDSAPADVAAQVAAVPGVQAVEGRTVVDAGLLLPNGDEIRARLIGLPTNQRSAVNDIYLESGRYLQPGDGQVALLDIHFAHFYDFKAGTQLRVFLGGREETFDSVGVAVSPEYLFLSPSEQEIIASARSFAILFVPQEALTRLLGAPDMINQLGVLVSSPDARTTTVSRVGEILKPFGLSKTTLRENIPAVQALQMDLEGYREIAATVPAMILIIAALSVYITLGRMVQGQRVQVGLARALGCSRRAIVMHYLLFALAIGIIGSIVGVAGGVWMGGSVTRVYASELGIPLVETRFYPVYVIGGIALSLLFCALGGIWPARSAARMRPAQAMRLDPSVALVSGKVPLLESIIERVLRLPLSLRLAIRNVLRVRRRSLASGLGIVFAFILVLSTWAMFDSMDWMMKVQYEEIDRWDLSAVYSEPKMPSVADDAAKLAGVEKSEALLQLPGKIKAGTQEHDVFIVGMTPSDDNLHHLRLGKGKTPAGVLGGSQIVMGPVLVDMLDVKPGDSVRLETPWGSGDFTFSAESAEMLGGTSVFVSLADAQAMIKAPVVNALYLKVQPDARKAVNQALYRQTGAAAVSLKEDTVSDFSSMMGMFYVFMGVLLIFCLAMAGAILFNAMTVSVLERQREVATLRALGESRGRITASILLENVILWALALVPGLVMGYGTALEMGAEFNSQLFRFEIIILPRSYVIAAVGILLTMFVAAIPAIRRVNRLRLAEATKVLT
jgi:putative ABC transport system permease protein